MKQNRIQGHGAIHTIMDNYVPDEVSPPCNENYKELTLQKLKKIYSSMSSPKYPETFSYIDPQQEVVHKCLGRLFQAGCSGPL